MKPLPLKKGNPEALIQKDLTVFLEQRSWLVRVMHGNLFQSGVPDLYICHKVYGARWVEVKLPGMIGSKFTKAQVIEFPKFISHGSPIWILTGADKKNYDALFEPSNLWKFMMAKL